MSCLSQVDLSKKGSIDEQIMDLVQYINAKDNYFTTSSCSGRISVFSEVRLNLLSVHKLKLTFVFERTILLAFIIINALYLV